MKSIPEGVTWQAMKRGATAGFVSEATWVNVRPECRIDYGHEHAHRIIQCAPILRRLVEGRFLGEALQRLDRAGYKVRAV